MAATYGIIQCVMIHIQAGSRDTIPTHTHIKQ